MQADNEQVLRAEDAKRGSSDTAPNSQRLIKSHLGGCLQTLSLLWQSISPCRSKHFCLLWGAPQWLHLWKLPHGKQLPGSGWLPCPSATQPSSQTDGGAHQLQGSDLPALF